MEALKKQVRHLTIVETNEKAWSSLDIEDFEDLFELADDAYMATLDTHLAEIELMQSEK
ncbi:MAG TPA: hypothetical protein V6C89_04930 [Drouetiella sp.]